jgi:hypothetical protein
MVKPQKTPDFEMSAQLVLGLIIAAIGALLALDNFGILEAREIFRYWPLALIAVGVAQILHAPTAGRGFGGVIWILGGVVLLGRQLGLWRVDVRDLWPLFLVALGSFIVWHAFHRKLPARPNLDVWTAGIESERTSADTEPISVDHGRTFPGAGPTAPDAGRARHAGHSHNARPAGSTISGVAVMSEFKRKVNVGEFRGGHLTAFMGGCNVDLRGATPAGGEAIVDVFALMGGIEIKVPDTWDVVNEVCPFMGGIEDKTARPTSGSAPRLILRGFVMMGGVVIQN